MTKRTEARTDGRNGLRVLQILHARAFHDHKRQTRRARIRARTGTKRGAARAPLGGGTKSKAAAAANRPYARL